MKAGLLTPSDEADIATSHFHAYRAATELATAIKRLRKAVLLVRDLNPDEASKLDAQADVLILARQQLVAIVAGTPLQEAA